MKIPGLETITSETTPNLNNNLNDLTDIEIVRLFLKTYDQSLYSILYKRYLNKVYAKCISLLKEEAQAEDAVQEVFLKIYLNLAKFNEKAKFSTWVYSITYNYCIDIIRRKKKEQNLFVSEIENPPDLVDDIEDKELLEIEVSKLKVVLENIPPADRAILLMKYQDDLKIKEIGMIMDKTESAIKMKIKRAKHKAQLVYNKLFKC